MNKDLSIQILNEVLEYFKLNITELANELNINKQNLYSITNLKKPNTISKKLADIICDRYPDISKSYLLTGNGDLLNDKNMSDNNNNNKKYKSLENLSKSILNSSELNKELVQLAKETLELSREHSNNFAKSIEMQEKTLSIIRDLIDNKEK